MRACGSQDTNNWERQEQNRVRIHSVLLELRTMGLFHRCELDDTFLSW